MQDADADSEGELRPCRRSGAAAGTRPSRDIGACLSRTRSLPVALLWVTLALPAMAADPAGDAGAGFRLPPLPSLPPQPLVPLPPASPAGAPPMPAALTLRAVRFEGHTQFTPAELEALAAPFLNRPLRALDIEELRQRVTRAYVERGYVNSGAVIAEGALQGETLTLRIVEGRITRLRQRGLQGLSERYLAARLLREGEVLEVNRLQERFRLQLADPLFARLNARLLPGEAPGAAVLDIEVTRAAPWQATVFANNHVAPAVGSTQAGMEGVWRDLAGWGDALAITLAGGEASRQADAAWSLPLLGSRTTLALRLADGESSVIEEPVAALDIKSRVATREATLAHPVQDDLRRRWAIGLTWAERRNRTSLAGIPFGFVPGEPEEGIRVESWRVFQELALRRERDVWALRASVLAGRNNLATAAVLPQQPPRRYHLWQLQGQASIATAAEEERGGPLVLRALLQRSRDHLVPLEQLAVGGRHTVRGYRENQLVRDNGWALGLEWHWPLWRDAVRRASLTLAPMLDAGAAWNREEPKSRLASAGFGLLWVLAEVEGELFLARRLERRDNPTHGDLQDRGIHLMLRWRPQP
ncbi:MAG: ShlB/FhaC/HecB family hemolysin secretion/activation protein [Burkholderiales bacterium]|nr:ShlB/FhaC/HecB family hemolysin secretion/activation protein [Burkholderiales bacterium]